MKLRPEIAQLHKVYADQIGSEVIAGPYALQGLTDWIRRSKPERVLEVGPGIGTTTTAIVRALGDRDYDYVAIEDDDFCLKALRRNLGDHHDRIRIYSDLPEGLGSFDFVVMDGPAGNERKILEGDQEAQASVARYFADLPARGVIFFEGSRHGQQQVLREVCGRPWAYMRIRPKGDVKGGFHIYQLNPTLAERLRFAADQGVRRVKARIR